MSDLKTTVLSQWHAEQGAKMVPFAGYTMPVQYKTGVLQEHLHTRSKAGLFDVSHMGQIRVSGENVAQVLEAVFPAALQELPANRQTYSILLNEQGGIVDDLMVCRREDDFLLVVNAGCKDKDLAYLEKLIGDKVTLRLQDDRALFALQGPEAANVLTALGADVSGLRFMDGAWITVAGIECWVTRSGYTGEDGFELSLANSEAEALAEALTAQDAVLPIGLGARDSLRLEAGLCLYGHELNEETSPLQAGLGWAIAKVRRPGEVRAGGFIAADILAKQTAKQKRIGLIAQGKAPIREGVTLFDVDNKAVGSVSSGTVGPSIGKPIAMAYVNNNAQVGDILYAEVRGKKLPMDVVKMPFIAHQYVKA